MQEGGSMLSQWAPKYDDILLGEVIGEGAFGTCFRALDKVSGAEVAVKRVRIRDVRRYSTKPKFQGKVLGQFLAGRDRQRIHPLFPLCNVLIQLLAGPLPSSGLQSNRLHTGQTGLRQTRCAPPTVSMHLCSGDPLHHVSLRRESHQRAVRG